MTRFLKSVSLRLFLAALLAAPFAPASVAARLRRRFPQSLADAPMMLPAPHTAMMKITPST